MPRMSRKPSSTGRVRPSVRKTVIAGVIVAVAAASLVACSSSGGSGGTASSSGASSSAKVTPKQGGSVLMVQNSIPGGLDPAKNKIWSFGDGPIMAALYGTLVYEEPATGKPVFG